MVNPTPYPPYSGFINYTPHLPKIYTGVYSLEQQIAALMKEYTKLTAYLEVVLKISNENDTNLLATIEELQNRLTTVYDFVQEIWNQFENIYKDEDRNALIYDPTQGEYVNSLIAQRNMYRELAVFGLREIQLENITVEELSKYTVDQVSAVGNYLINNINIPRVTDPETGLEYVLGD